MTGVREELASLAAEAPNYANAAKAVRRARKRRMRNTVASVAAVVLVAVGTVVPVLWLRDGGGAAPSTNPSPSSSIQLYHPDQTVGDTRLPPGTLDKTGQIGRVWRSPYGWVLMGPKGTYYVYDGRSDLFELAPAGTAPTVSADGRLVAWAQNGRAMIADLTKDPVQIGDAGVLPRDTRVQQWAGDRLVLTNASRQNWQVWRPGEAVDPNWRQGQFRTADRTGTYGLIISTTDCLQKVDLSTFVMADELCDGMYTVVESSPDLRWLWLERSGQPLLADAEDFFATSEGVKPLGPTVRDVIWGGGSWFAVSSDGATLVEVSTSGSILEETSIAPGTVLVEMPSG